MAELGLGVVLEHDGARAVHGHAALVAAEPVCPELGDCGFRAGSSAEHRYDMVVLLVDA